MKIIILGSVLFTKKVVDFLIKKNIAIDGVIGKKNSTFNSDFIDLVRLYKNKFDTFYTQNINDKRTYKWLKNKRPDLIICLGWSHIIEPKVLKIPKYGIIGYHPSDLPRNKGRHPIIWPLVLGLKETASTFFLMNSEIDSGEIVSKKKVQIRSKDFAFDLYKKLYQTASKQLLSLIKDFQKGKIKKLKKSNVKENYWKKRSFKDGMIDWRMDAESIFNLTRALGKPYGGAHFYFNNKMIKVWRTKIIHSKFDNIEPGKIIKLANLKPVIKCGKNSLKLINFSPKIRFKKDNYL